ncbi:hypothetical protein ARTHRO9AX_220313 [Arthrobacter sp. 9AX]|nr:hypothetical protein ARTHRO9AX_220313 [Arthrobacter sp. 9AX]
MVRVGAQLSAGTPKAYAGTLGLMGRRPAALPSGDVLIGPSTQAAWSANRSSKTFTRTFDPSTRSWATANVKM